MEFTDAMIRMTGNTRCHSDDFWRGYRIWLDKQDESVAKILEGDVLEGFKYGREEKRKILESSPKKKSPKPKKPSFYDTGSLSIKNIDLKKYGIEKPNQQ